MKYNSSNQPTQCIMTNSTCYKGTSKLTSFKGVLWHCTGANNPNLKRYVQPSKTDVNYSKLIAALGTNTNGNDWNHVSVQAGVHAWIGKLASGEVTTMQTLPWEYKPWGCGSGSKGSCNNGWLQFEICEDGLTDKTYFDKCYKEAIELTAYLCKKYNLNPKGKTTLNSVSVPVILCHYDSYKLGLGTNHGDVYNWFNKFGKTMDDVRNDVAKLLEEPAAAPVQTTAPAPAATTTYVTKICHSSISENGNAGKDGKAKAGDQTGKEVCIREWYNKPWGIMLRYPNKDIAKKASEAAKKLAKSNLVGYDQTQRNTLYQKLKKYNWDVDKYIASKEKCESDCSSFVYACYCIYIPGMRSDSNAPTTSTMRSKYKAYGFTLYTDSKYRTSKNYLLPGDVLVKEGSHTVMAVQEKVTTTTTPTTTTNSEFLVKIITASLNVRKGPGTSYDVATTVKLNGVYTIVEEKSGWGKLKSGAGWISLNSAYVKRV